MDFLTRYPSVSQSINLSRELPVLDIKIRQVKTKARKELAKLNYFSINNIQTPINIIDDEEEKPKRGSIKKRTIFKTINKLSYNSRFRVSFPPSNSVNRSGETKVAKTKTKIRKSNLKPLNATSTHLQLHHVAFEHTKNSSRNSRHFNTEVHSFRQPTKPSELYDQCKEIEDNCSTILNTCPNENVNNPVADILKKENKKMKYEEVEELRKFKRGMNPNRMMKLRMKNIKTMIKAEQVEKLDDTLAFRANKLIKGIFIDKNKNPYFEKEHGYNNFNDTRYRRKNKIKELKKAINENVQDNKKVVMKYNRYLLTEE